MKFRVSIPAGPSARALAGFLLGFTALSATLAGQQCVAPPTDMVAWYPFDETVGPVAEDLVGRNDGLYVDGTSVPGRVSNALRIGAPVEAPNHPNLEFGAGDFSIDVWLDGPTIGGILRKLNGVTGFEIFTDIVVGGSSPAFLFVTAEASGGGFTSRPCGTISRDSWAHLTVTFDRDGDTICYVDGDPVGTIAIPSPGAIDNAEPLQIGADFIGTVDELEIFDRVLSPSEIQSIVDAKELGKCKEMLHVPWDEPVTNCDDSRQVSTEICNHSSSPQSYAFNGCTPLPVGSPGGCNVPGPTSCTPANPLVTINPGQCATMDIVVDNPPGMEKIHDIACFEIHVDNTTNDRTLTDSGSLWVSRVCGIEAGEGGGDVSGRILANDSVITVDQGEVATLTLRFENFGGARSLAYAVDPVRSDMSAANTVLSLAGLPPGASFFDELLLAPGEVVVREIEVRFTGIDVFNFYDVVLRGTPEGGEERIWGSVGVRNTFE